MLIQVGYAWARVKDATQDELDFLTGYLTFTSRRHTGEGTSTSLLTREGLFPAGLADMVVRTLRERGTAVQRVQRAIPGLVVPPEKVDLSVCWPHQRDAIMEVLQGRYRGVIQHATGTGKGTTISVLCKHVVGRVLVVVPSKQLLIEMRDRLAKHGIKAGAVGDGRRDLSPRVVVCIAASLKTLKKHDLEGFVAVLVDECFPAGTLVGGVPIEQIKVGDTVPSYDEANGTFVHRKVLKTFVTPARSMVRIHMADGREVVCTAGHPFLTEIGWLPALALGGHLVASRPNDTGNHEVPDVRRGVRPVEATALRPEAAGDSIGVLVEMPPSWGGNGRNEACQLGENVGRQPDAAAGEHRQDGGGAAIQGALEASHSRREWHRDDRSTEPTIGCSGSRMGGRARHTDTEQRSDNPTLLQGRSGPARGHAGCRGGWQHPQDEAREGERREEGPGTVWARVDRVEVLEPGDREWHERLCPGGVVYNLHVEGTETYLVDGLVVHNCHGVPSPTLLEPLMRCVNAAIRLGFSGTPMERADKKSLYIVGVLGEVIHRFTPTKAVDRGIVARCRLRMVPFQHPFHSTAGRYDQWERRAIVRNKARNLLLTRLVCSSESPRIVFVRTKEHQAVLAKLLGVDCLTVNDETPSKQVQSILTTFKAGSVGTLVSTPIFRQGVDLPEVNTVINGAGGKATIDVIQKVGRGSRRFQADGSTKDEFRVYDIDDRGCGCGGAHKSCIWLERHSEGRNAAYLKFGYVALAED